MKRPSRLGPPISINEPATFIESPGAEGTSFDHLTEALIFASNIPPGDRHARAEIVTQSGSRYGWDAIVDLVRHVN